MSRSVEKFIASVEVKTWFADGISAAAKPPSSKRAPQQEAAAGRGEGSVSLEDATKAIGTLRCLRDAALSHYYVWISQQKRRSAESSCVCFWAHPEYVITLWVQIPNILF